MLAAHAFYPHRYRQRNTIERLMNRRKQFRALAYRTTPTC